MKTQEEKSQAIARLKLNKIKCREFSAFGDPCHLSIDGMIRVIHEDLDEDEIYDLENELEISAYERDGMLSALDWLNDGCELEDLLYPEQD